MKKVIVVIIVALVAAGGFYMWKQKNGKPEETESKQKVVEASRGEIIHSVEASGVVASNLDVEIKCKASGEIITLPFEESDTVKKGELVLELDPVDEQRNVKKATVSLNSAKARLNKSKQTLKVAEQNLETAKNRAQVTLATAKATTEETLAKEKRVRQLYERKLASQEELESAETSAVQAKAELEKAGITIEELKTQEVELELKRQDVSLAAADVESSQISLDIAQQRLEETKVYAPIDGVITSRTVQEGQIITSATGNVSGGTAVMVISDLSKLYIDASVDESDIGNVAVGQEVKISADAFPDETFQGIVERIAPKGSTVSNVVTFQVRIGVSSGRPGGMGRREMGASKGSGSGEPVKNTAAGMPVAEGAPDSMPGGRGMREARMPGDTDMADGMKMPETEEEKAAFMQQMRERRAKRAANMKKSSLKPEMTADVEIIIAQKSDIVTLPAEAVGRKRGKRYVKVLLDEEKTEERDVEVGISDGASIEIVSGLETGEKVVVEKGSAESRWRQGGPPPGGMIGGRGSHMMMRR